MKSKLFATLLVVLALPLASPTALFAQKTKGKAAIEEPVKETPKADPKAELMQRYQSIYQAALGYNDFAVATDAMYHMIALSPDKAELKDTLAALYFQRAAWPQVILITSEILEKNTQNQAALELRAVANQSFGRAKEALEDYEDLYKLTGNPYHLYEIAALQFTMKRYGECDMSVRTLLADPGIADKKIAIGSADGSSQDISMAAAVNNLHGVMDLEQGKKDSAKAYFETALKISPEFILAKNNLEALNTMK